MGLRFLYTIYSSELRSGVHVRSFVPLPLDTLAIASNIVWVRPRPWRMSLFAYHDECSSECAFVRFIRDCLYFNRKWLGKR